MRTLKAYAQWYHKEGILKGIFQELNVMLSSSHFVLMVSIPENLKKFWSTIRQGSDEISFIQMKPNSRFIPLNKQGYSVMQQNCGLGWN